MYVSKEISDEAVIAYRDSLIEKIEKAALDLLALKKSFYGIECEIIERDLRLKGIREGDDIDAVFLDGEGRYKYEGLSDGRDEKVELKLRPYTKKGRLAVHADLYSKSMVDHITKVPPPNKAVKTGKK